MRAPFRQAGGRQLGEKGGGSGLWKAFTEQAANTSQLPQVVEVVVQHAFQDEGIGKTALEIGVVVKLVQEGIVPLGQQSHDCVQAVVVFRPQHGPALLPQEMVVPPVFRVFTGLAAGTGLDFEDGFLPPQGEVGEQFGHAVQLGQGAHEKGRFGQAVPDPLVGLADPRPAGLNGVKLSDKLLQADP